MTLTAACLCSKRCRHMPGARSRAAQTPRCASENPSHLTTGIRITCSAPSAVRSQRSPTMKASGLCAQTGTANLCVSQKSPGPFTSDVRILTTLDVRACVCCVGCLRVCVVCTHVLSKTSLTTSGGCTCKGACACLRVCERAREPTCVRTREIW
jgi:hypothetical protein